jgi:hypothetical protein
LLHLVRPDVGESVALENQDYRGHVIPRNSKPQSSRLQHLQFVLRDLAEEPRLFEHLEHQRSLPTIAVKSHDHERLRVAHCDPLSSSRTGCAVLVSAFLTSSGRLTAGDVPSVDGTGIKGIERMHIE